MNHNDMIKIASEAALMAGEEIMKIYNDSEFIDFKKKKDSRWSISASDIKYYNDTSIISERLMEGLPLQYKKERFVKGNYVLDLFFQS